MNAIEIEAAIWEVAAAPFDRTEFPYAFLAAFDNKETTIKRLRSGDTNKSDLGGVLQVKNIHILVAPEGQVRQSFDALKNSPATVKSKARFILATDGIDFEAEDLESDEPPVVCAYKDFPEHFWIFLPLANITTVKQVRDNLLDIRAANRLNRLYVELLKANPEWEFADQRLEMNHFMARLIFCFFAEDTGIFQGESLFTETVGRYSVPDSSNTHEVIRELFRAMNLKEEDRPAASLPRWAAAFPYVNGHLFSGNIDVPKFNKQARNFLRHIGSLEWTKINPDIFGSMIQAVADDEERGALGMHYTSVPNILKVLNPLFLDDLREQLSAAGENARMLLNLKKRLSKIRVFDPACGSGNFLVIAYKQLREIEHEINMRRSGKDSRSEIPLTNFRGIELRPFPSEIARLALIIAEYQCNQVYLGQQEALAVFLPLESRNWITCGNALRLDWLSIFSPTGRSSEGYSGDLLEPAQPQLEFENEGGETYICGNPPYKGSQWQTEEQKADLKGIFGKRTNTWKSLDYVSGWFMKAADYGIHTNTVTAFVSTNSICQGRQVDTLWSLIFAAGYNISFAHTSFKWANLASFNAGVTVVIVGISNQPGRVKRLFSETGDTGAVLKIVDNINAYLVSGPNVIVRQETSPISNISEMSFGNMPNDGGNLLLDVCEENSAIGQYGVERDFIRPFVGSQEFIRGIERRCIWVSDDMRRKAIKNDWLNARFDLVEKQRSTSDRNTTKELAKSSHRFGEVRQKGEEQIIAVAAISSENRDYLPCGLLPRGTIISNKCFALFDSPLWNMALIASRLHWVWIGTVCVRMRTDFSYSNTLGWNTFPVPRLTENNKADLERCAKDILLAREAYFPDTIADLYAPQNMPPALKAAHDRNDEVLEGIYIGRRFRNDTERLEKLFDLYTKMTATKKAIPKMIGKRKSA